MSLFSQLHRTFFLYFTNRRLYQISFSCEKTKSFYRVLTILSDYLKERWAKKDKVTRHDLRHDNHTVSLLTDHLVFSSKYRRKVLLGEVSEAAEEIIRETCKELDIEVIDMAVGVDHIHLFIKYPPKYSVSWIAKRIKGRSSKLLRDRFSHLKEWCPDNLWAPSCYHGSIGHGWEVVEKYISGQKGHCLEKTDVMQGRVERRDERGEPYSYDKADVMP